MVRPGRRRRDACRCDSVRLTTNRVIREETGRTGAAGLNFRSEVPRRLAALRAGPGLVRRRRRDVLTELGPPLTLGAVREAVLDLRRPPAQARRPIDTSPLAEGQYGNPNRLSIYFLGLLVGQLGVRSAPKIREDARRARFVGRHDQRLRRLGRRQSTSRLSLGLGVNLGGFRSVLLQ